MEQADKVWVPHPSEIWQPAEVIVYNEKSKKLTVEKEENGEYSVFDISEGMHNICNYNIKI